jgi:alpha-galactosidase
MKTTSQPVYGFNYWYYAYGESSYEDIVSDTDLLLEVSEGLENRPFMVIDDGWSINPCGGPNVANDKFKDMKKLAKVIKEKGARPGIWIRPLKDESHHLDIPRHPLREVLLDPTCEETIALIKEDFSKLTKWGYELIKFDFVTVDIYLNYGFEMPDNLVSSKWRYKHNNLTNAEIILKMHRTIREVTPNVVLIGCNAITHLCAGIVEINRIGDDISGMEWERTRKYGVNSLAYRLVQNDIFYKIDADCVGIMGKYSWDQNRLWLDLLAKSGSPLFVSCDPKVADQKVKQDIKDAFIINCKQDNICYPIDYKQNLLPTKWIIDGEVVEYDWHLIP